MWQNRGMFQIWYKLFRDVEWRRGSSDTTMAALKIEASHDYCREAHGKSDNFRQPADVPTEMARAFRHDT
jgi:hypothetical protein